MNRVNGVRFDGLHSFHDLDMWLSERPDWGSPEPKLNLVEIPGADGVLDLTEANAGDVKFNNRQITLTFAAMVKAEEQERFKSRIMNTLHGKVIQQIIPDRHGKQRFLSLRSIHGGVSGCSASLHGKEDASSASGPIWRM